MIVKGNVADDVKLNKTHAEAILYEPPSLMNTEFPHVLSGVVSTSSSE